jgi:hypothetical protein
MADRKISDLTALTTPASGDYLPIVDISEAAAASKNKRITIEELMRGVPDGTAAAPGIAFETDPNTGIYSPGADHLAVATNGTKRLQIDSGGNVAIDAVGDTGLKPLSVYSQARDCELRLITNSGTENNAFVTLRQSGGNLDLYSTNGAITLNPANTERLRITAAGLVGVGNSSPGGQLTVYSAGNQIRVESPTSSNADILFRENDVTKWTAGYVPFISGFRFSNGSSDILTLTNTGNVGIGTTSVSRLLHISAASGDTAARIQTATSGAFLEFQDSATTAGRQPLIGAIGDNLVVYTSAGSYSERARIDSSGRLGIGTSVPGALLNLQGTFGTSLTTGLRIDGLGSTTNNVSPIAFYIQSSNWGTQHAANIACGTLTGLDGGGYLRFSTSPDGNTAPAERLRITATGLVGIGSSTPGKLLEIGTGGAAENSTYMVRINRGVTGEYADFSADNGFATLDGINGAGGGVRFLGDGNERARIDSSGRLLVGTSTARTNVFTIAPRIQYEGSGASENRFVSFGYSSADTAGPGIAIFKTRAASAGGNTAVVNADMLGELRFCGADGTNIIRGAAIGAFVDGTPSANDLPGRLVFSTTADGASSPTERMRITNGGFLRVSCADAPSSSNRGVSIGPNGPSGMQIAIANTLSGTFAGNVVFINANGQVGSIDTSASSTSYVTSSDYRLKHDVQPMTGALAKLALLKPRFFKWNVDGSQSQGFIAHELQEVVPECVSGTKDAVDNNGSPKYQGIDTGFLVATLTAALQEAIAKIESLEARLTAAGIE